MTDKRLKDKIKAVKKSIRDYKKEAQLMRKCEEWGALDALCLKLEALQFNLAELEKLYKKEE